MDEVFGPIWQAVVLVVFKVQKSSGLLLTVYQVGGNDSEV
jgi:hypothetical protein